MTQILSYALFITSIFMVGASFLLSFRMRFIQFRMFPQLFAILFQSKTAKQADDASHPALKNQKTHTVKGHQALYTAMSTTIGISTIVSPVIAISLGGPGIVLGFMMATIFGAAVNYVEVTFALHYRKINSKGEVSGGPMQYIQDEVSPQLAKIYAMLIFILMMAWSSAQSNQLAEVLNSDLLDGFRIPNYVTGIVVSLATLFILKGGIKRVADLSSQLVPLMFLTYVSASVWIVCCNLEKLPAIIQMIFQSALTPTQFGTGAAVGGLLSTMRWGVMKGIHSCEAGVGTQTIPHSMAEAPDPAQQGMLSMLSAFTACFLCLLSCAVALMTESWLDHSVSLGINMVAKSYHQYFSYGGVIIVMISAFIFAFGTIVGNSFNGSQTFKYIFDRKWLKYYYAATGVIIFLGSVADVQFVWSNVDLILIPIVFINTLTIVYLSYKRRDLLEKSTALEQKESLEAVYTLRD